jgi:hypothetical protein
MGNAELSEHLASLVLASQRHCNRCRRGRMELIEERMDEHFGVLGVTVQKLQCQTCGVIVVE